MKIYYSRKFAKEYKKLPIRLKIQAEKKEKIFRNNPLDPRLKTHKLTGKLQEFWSFSIDHKHRIIFEFESSQTVWFHSVGTHQIYR